MTDLDSVDMIEMIKKATIHISTAVFQKLLSRLSQIMQSIARNGVLEKCSSFADSVLQKHELL